MSLLLAFQTAVATSGQALLWKYQQLAAMAQV
jgi:hypothetical protein